MDRARKADARRAPARGWPPPAPRCSSPPTTPEFAAAFAERVVLLADGRLIADGPAAEVLAGGWYFATETARDPGGAGGALMPEEGAALLRAPRARLTPGGHVRHELAARLVRCSSPSRSRAGFALVRARRARPSRVLALVATLAALAALGRVAFAPLPNVKPTTDIVLLSGYVLGGAPGFAVGALGALASNFVLRAGPVDAVADGRLGAVRRDRGAGLARVAGRAARPRWRWPSPAARPGSSTGRSSTTPTG